MFNDFVDLISSSRADVQFFKAETNSQTWRKPRGATMLHIVLFTAGGGGGGGMTGLTTTVRGGGGGGGGGAIIQAIVPLWSLPDTLYLWVPRGGAGGAATQNGSTGNVQSLVLTSNIAVGLFSSTTDQVLGGQAGFLGGAGTAGSTGGSAAGGAGAGASGSNGTLATPGIRSFTGGQTGAAGGVVGGGAGSGFTVAGATPYRILGGCGGATTAASNADFDGGAVTGAGLWPGTAGGVGGTGNKGDGSPTYGAGIGVIYGGVGGGSGGAGNGGDGQDGAYPGGGGGGGGGGITGGKGGKGGDGLTIMIAW